MCIYHPFIESILSVSNIQQPILAIKKENYVLL